MSETVGNPGKTKYKGGMRTFYTIVLTQTLSIIGSRISSLAIGIWLYNETGNATPLALVAFFGMLPMILAASFAGVLADRWDRRYVMAISDGGQAVGTVLLMLSFLLSLFTERACRWGVADGRGEGGEDVADQRRCVWDVNPTTALERVVEVCLH